MRKLIAIPLLAMLACAPQDDREEQLDPGAPATEADLPDEVSEESLSAWSVRLDDPTGDPGGLNIISENDGLVATTGAAGLAWRPIDLVMGGDFSVSASFQHRNVAGGEGAYGIFVGGKNLKDPDQSYSYFMVRNSGEYMIGHRDGDEVHTVVDWKSSGTAPLVDTGSSSQTLAVEVHGEEVRFLLNGKTIETLPRSEVEPHGGAGVRLDPNLDVTVRNWTVNRPGGASS